ncbi:MAG TPA: ketoacyl-ACP synthase III [Clostridiaceae bacterium]|jgi:3-oxoacyl-[acyl-carrier-protein] synthase-3|nr:ketoacyl-ACP synthase III [Clostridiaceae bacterium]
MSFYKSNGIKIAGMTCVVPKNRITVESFSSIFGEEIPAKFSAGTGIKAMYKALPEQTASDLATAAAESLFEKIEINRDDIGLMLLVTQSPDYRRPSSANVIHKRLDLPIDCACMEINLGCSGFIYGLQTAMSLMASTSSDQQYGLLLMGETASKLVDPHDKSIVMMYGDAGAAILLEKTSESISSTTLLRSDGSRYKAIILPAGGFRDMNPRYEKFMCRDGIERSLYDIYMDGTSVFSFSITDVPKALNDYLEYTETSINDYDSFIFHQANEFIIKQLVRKLKLIKDTVPISLDRYGNTGGISIPLTMCDAYGENASEIKKVLMAGFGIGLSWGVTSIPVNIGNIYPITETSDYYIGGKITPEML